MSTTVTPAPAPLQAIEAHIAPLRHRLTHHPLYAHIQAEPHLRLFMESHVFAVWDFMSLLKALQARLTCVDVPWVPSPWARSRRFINEIVLGEESDEYNGEPLSHFELYLHAMESLGADVQPVQAVVAQARERPGHLELDLAGVPAPARAFVEHTFTLIRTGSLPAMSAAFTFGREDVIPAMFHQMVRDLNAKGRGHLETLIWYLERHIEVDGEDHGPLALGMVQDLCGNDPVRWTEASHAAEASLNARLALWDGILASIESLPTPA